MPSLVRFTLALVTLVAGLGGIAPAGAQEPVAQPRVVVAVIDSPANPYHELYNAGGSLYGAGAPSSVTPDVLAEFGIDESHIITMTRTGNFVADFAKDKAQFDAIRRGEPYWFRGTNVIGISFNSADGSRLRPDGNGSTHGVGTTSAVLKANPEAVVVSVESPGAPLGVPGFATQPLGEAWSFGHPAVDVVSTSYGPPGSPPLGYHLTDSYKGVVGRGKFHTGAADNSPALSPIDATSGPWWTIGVAGYHEGSTEGREMQSGTLPDFVADFTQNLPYCRKCETGTSNVSGTSFSTPRTAGTLSKIILEARRAAGHLGGIVTAGVPAPVMVRGNGLALTNWDIRRALEEAAYYPARSEQTGGGPILDQAPWATAGWGAVSPEPARRVVTEALGRLGIGTQPTRSKDDATCTFMTANMAARHAWWDVGAAFSQSQGNLARPIKPC